MSENFPNDKIDNSNIFGRHILGYLNIKTIRHTTTKLLEYTLSETIVGEALKNYFGIDPKDLFNNKNTNKDDDILEKFKNEKDKFEFYNNKKNIIKKENTKIENDEKMKKITKEQKFQKKVKNDTAYYSILNTKKMEQLNLGVLCL